MYIDYGHDNPLQINAAESLVHLYSCPFHIPLLQW